MVKGDMQHFLLLLMIFFNDFFMEFLVTLLELHQEGSAIKVQHIFDKIFQAHKKAAVWSFVYFSLSVEPRGGFPLGSMWRQE